MEDIKKYVAGIAVLLVCGLFISGKRVSIKKVSFEVSLPMLGSGYDGQIVSVPLIDTVIIYYDSSHIVYRWTVYHSDIDSWGKVVEDTSIYSDESEKGLYGTFVETHRETKRSLQTSYFGYRKGEDYGVQYYPYGKQVSRQRVDTMRAKWGGEQFRTFLRIENFVLIDTKATRRKVTEKYIPVEKKDETYPDSLFVYYDATIKGDFYSFHPKLEEKNKMKIAQIVMLYKEGYSEIHAAIVPEREISVRMLDSEIPDYNEISKIFEKFRKNDFH